MSDATLVTTAKPKVGGAAYIAPVGTSLPETASETLAAAFKGLGHISEDGVTNSNSPESDSVKAWGGETVLTMQTAKEDKFKFTLLEAMNPEVLKAVYGAGNVTGTISGTGGLKVRANSTELEAHAWVFDTILKGGVLRRVVIPNATISEIGDIVYKDDEALAYEVTIDAVPSADADGDTHYELMAAPASPEPDPGDGEE